VVVQIMSTVAALSISMLLLSGITVDASSTLGKIVTLFDVAMIFGVVNAVLRPIVKVVGCGFYVLTLGLAAVLVNGLLLLLTSWIASLVHLPFHVSSFWTAVLGALIVGVTNWIVNLVVPDRLR
jgi:putative membrane protein